MKTKKKKNQKGKRPDLRWATEEDLEQLAFPAIALRLPIAPSTNHLYNRGRAGRTWLAPTVKAWRDEAILLIRHQIGLLRPFFPGHLNLAVVMHVFTDAARDLDNVWKATLDAMTHAGVWADDRQVRQLFSTIEHNAPNVDPNSLFVRIGTERINWRPTYESFL